MAYQILHTIETGASAAENYTKDYKEVWLLDSMADYNPFIFSRKRKNCFIAEWSGSTLVYFIVDSCNISRGQPMPGGQFQCEVDYKLRHFESLDELKAPWDLPPFGFRIGTALNEESTSKFYPGNDDIWLPQSDETANFVNTAGVMLEGTATYSTSQISFSYCISYVKFYQIQNWFWSLAGKINNDRVTICGMTFAPRTIKLDALNAEYNEVEIPGTVLERIEWINGQTVLKYYTVEPVNYHYFRIDVTLHANPKTWNQYFLNVGTHVNRNGVISRLWSWQHPTTGDMVFGTYNDYVAQNGRDGQPVSEPVALNQNGSNASPIGANGRQIMTYRHGSLFEPIAFADLEMPAEPPRQWEHIS